MFSYIEIVFHQNWCVQAERYLINIGFLQKREIPWEKVPFVPRPSLVPDPITVFGKKIPQKEGSRKVDKIVITPSEKARIRPKILIQPPKPYVSPRDATRERVFSLIRKEEMLPKNITSSDAMDIALPRLHKLAELPNLPYKKKIAVETPYVF